MLGVSIGVGGMRFQQNCSEGAHTTMVLDNSLVVFPAFFADGSASTSPNSVRFKVIGKMKRQTFTGER